MYCVIFYDGFNRTYLTADLTAEHLSCAKFQGSLEECEQWIENDLIALDEWYNEEYNS